jgi:[ribosomal protein S18]-alanine N-acetyltransferase
MSNIVIRPMELFDLDEIMKIEKESFATPWDRSSFENELQDNKFANYYILSDGDQIVGYCGLWVVFDAAQITNIAILPQFRGKKYGEMLFDYVVKQAKELEATELSLEVRVSNVVAQKLYRKFGLVPVGVRKNYYIDNQEDAIVMWVKL